MTKLFCRREFLGVSTATAVTALAGSGWTAEQNGKANRPKVLLLGDSIRLSYQPAVAKKLASVAEVVGPEENCQFASYTLSSLDRWIERLGKPDITLCREAPRWQRRKSGRSDQTCHGAIAGPKTAESR